MSTNSMLILCCIKYEAHYLLRDAKLIRSDPAPLSYSIKLYYHYYCYYYYNNIR